MDKYGVIMAGGGGTRFWPLSRKELPKQFLNLTGNDLLINETIDRLALNINKNNIYAITSKDYISTILDVTKGRLIPRHIISEPAMRSTLACVGFAAISIFTEYGDGVMVAAPSDAYVDDWNLFSETLDIAVNVAEKEDKIVTIGISPKFPATGYGYIKYQQPKDKVCKVEQFVEKPNKETAEKYITESYLWNSGIFVVKISSLLAMIKKYAADVYADIEKLGVAVIQNDYSMVNEIYPLIRKISFDYAVVEPASLNDEVLVVPGNFNWSDVGTWDMIDAVHTPDSKGNVVVGDTLLFDTSDSVIISKKKLVAVLGVDNIVVVDTDDALLICEKSRAQDVKNIVEKLKETGRSDLI